MKAGDICKVRLTQADGSTKERPVLLIKKVDPFKDWIVAVVTSQLRNRNGDLDILLDQKDAGFRSTGLRKTSLIKLGQIHTLNTGLIMGKMGELPLGMIGDAKASLSRFLAD